MAATEEMEERCAEIDFCSSETDDERNELVYISTPPSGSSTTGKGINYLLLIHFYVMSLMSCGHVSQFFQYLNKRCSSLSRVYFVVLNIY